MKSGMKRIVVGLILLGGLPRILSSAPGQTPEPERTKFSSLQKSLLVPGWGQFVEKRYFEAGFFLTLEVCYLVEVFRTNRKGNNAYRLYKAAASAEEAIRFRDMTEDFDKTRNYHMALAAAVWAVNLVDMYFIFRRKGRTESHLRVGADVSREQGLSIHGRLSF